MKSLELTRELLEVIEDNDKFKEAMNKAWHSKSCYDVPKSMIRKLKLPKEQIESAMLFLEDTERCVLISVMTSDKEPEPLSGGGEEYGFFINPMNSKVAISYVGGWRA